MKYNDTILFYERGDFLKRIAISQSNYLPWKGYFDLVQTVDEFIILDTVQYTKRDWRNRNLIKTPHGLKWISIPVKQKGNYYCNIIDMTIVNHNWISEHLNVLANYYRKAKCYNEVFEFIKNCFDKCSHIDNLSEINRILLNEICEVLKIDTVINFSENFVVSTEPSQRLIDLCNAVEATHYLSGPSAKAYLNEDLFKEAGIVVEWMSYDNYPEYPQMHGEFIHGVSIIDLFFNVGLNDAKDYINKKKSSLVN